MSYRAKVILCGESGVGKSSLLARYVDRKFSDQYQQTIGANFLIKEIDLVEIVDKLEIEREELINDIKQKGFKVYIWDIGGQQDKLFANEYYFVQAVGAMVIFSLNDLNSFNEINFWIAKLKNFCGDIPFIVIGNKSDLERKVIDDVINLKIAELGVLYFETSAKLNKNVDAAFEMLSIQILNSLK
jgi:small GTP-binding protein